MQVTCLPSWRVINDSCHPFVLAWTSRSLRKVPQPPGTVSSRHTHSCVCALCVYMFICIGTRMWASITLYLIALFYNFISLFLCLWVCMSLCMCGRQRTTLRSQLTPFRHVCPEDWSQVADLAVGSFTCWAILPPESPYFFLWQLVFTEWVITLVPTQSFLTEIYFLLKVSSLKMEVGPSSPNRDQSLT